MLAHKPDFYQTALQKEYARKKILLCAKYTQSMRGPPSEEVFSNRPLFRARRKHKVLISSRNLLAGAKIAKLIFHCNLQLLGGIPPWRQGRILDFPL